MSFVKFTTTWIYLRSCSHMDSYLKCAIKFWAPTHLLSFPRKKGRADHWWNAILLINVEAKRDCRSDHEEAKGESNKRGMSLRCDTIKFSANANYSSGLGGRRWSEGSWSEVEGLPSSSIACGSWWSDSDSWSVCEETEQEKEKKSPWVNHIFLVSVSGKLPQPLGCALPQRQISSTLCP